MDDSNDRVVQFLRRSMPLPPLAYSYRQHRSVDEYSQSTVVAIFCNGYAQTMNNRLAIELENYLCDKVGLPFIRFADFHY